MKPKVKEYLIDFFLSPLTKNLPFLAMLTLLLAFPILFLLFQRSYYEFILYLFVGELVESYILTLPLAFFTKEKLINRIYKILLAIYGLFWCAIIIFHVFVLHTYFESNFVAIVLATNINETIEFITQFVSLKYMLICFGYLLLVTLVYCFVKRFAKPSFFIIIGGIVAYIGIIFVLIHNPAIIKELSLYRSWSFVNYNLPDSQELWNHPDIIIEDEHRPDKIIIIIGESFNKTHSSLYGYHKNTNPRLMSLRDSSQLILFDEVTTTASNTIAAFVNFMTTYNNDLNITRNWYNYPNIIEILHECGYETNWLSNQNKYGICDNIPSIFSKICDSQFFVNDKIYEVSMLLDERIIPELRRNIKVGHPQAFVCHLIGSHSSFENRYPANRTIWEVDDYMDRPSNQRRNLSHYDNSIAYNDSVVYEIMRSFDGTDAIAFYFSDHGLDVYQSTEDYIGHALSTKESRMYAGDIPFMIYFTKVCMQKHPDIVNIVRGSQHNKFDTTNFIYALMDIIGVSFTDQESKCKTLFRSRSDRYDK